MALISVAILGNAYSYELTFDEVDLNWAPFECTPAMAAAQQCAGKNKDKDYKWGRIITDDFSDLGVIFAGYTDPVSQQGSSNPLVLFNTDFPTYDGSGDPDLASPMSEWGNPNNTKEFGNVLIVHEVNSSSQKCVYSKDKCKRSDDRGAGGVIEMTFTTPVTFESLDLLDAHDNGGSVSVDYLLNGSTVTKVYSITDLGSSADHTWQSLNINLNNVVSASIEFFKSGAIDNLRFVHNVPEPSTIALLFSLLALIYLRKNNPLAKQRSN